MKRTSSAVLALLFLATPLLASPPAVTTVLLVRHAEKAGTEGDVPLSEAGAARAAELARVLTGVQIDVIYTTQWQRTRSTAAPVAETLGLTPVVTPTNETYARDLAKRILADHAGQTVLVVGHSNTTGDVLRALGTPDPPPIPESQYDDLFVCTVADGTAKVIALRYGAVKR